MWIGEIFMDILSINILQARLIVDYYLRHLSEDIDFKPKVKDIFNFLFSLKFMILVTPTWYKYQTISSSSVFKVI